MPAVLQIREVAKRFGETEAIRGVDLAVDQHEFFALLGASGSGKTTLLRVVAGLEAPDAGQLLINDREVTRLPPYARKIGMVFQDLLLFPHRTVAENVVFPLRMQGRGRAEQEQQLAWVLDLVRLKGTRGALSAPALGRPEAAGRARPRPGLPALGAAPG